MTMKSKIKSLEELIPIVSARRGAGKPTVVFTNNHANIVWETNEFTTYQLRYGTSSGNYTHTATGALFDETHVANLVGLDEDTYYFQITSTDLSGNQSTSPEYTFSAQSFIYLPMVIR